MTPLYIEIRNFMMSQIMNGHIKLGEKIPTERELMELFGTSRMTVRHAIDKMVDDGVLTRVVGRGTFVSSEKINVGLNILKGFSEEIEESGHVPGARLISKTKTTADESLAKMLHIDTGAPVLKVIRLRYVDNLEMALTVSFFPALRALDLEAVNFGAVSIYKELLDVLGLVVDKADETISAVSANGEQAKLLRVNKGAALLFLSRLSMTSRSVPIEFMEGVFRPDRYVITKELFRKG